VLLVEDLLWILDVDSFQNNNGVSALKRIKERNGGLSEQLGE